jgi:hypothetical protein
MAAARALRCAYCVSVHGDNMLKSELFDRAQVEAIMRDYRTAGLEPMEVAVMALAEKVALHAYKVTPEDVDELRAFGLTDAEIFNVVLAAAARCFLQVPGRHGRAAGRCICPYERPDRAAGTALAPYRLSERAAASFAVSSMERVASRAYAYGRRLSKESEHGAALARRHLRGHGTRPVRAHLRCAPPA